jgi:hypothetical protein
MTTISPTPSDLHDTATLDQICSAIASAYQYMIHSGSHTELCQAESVFDILKKTCTERKTGISVRWLLSQLMSLGISKADAWQDLDSVASDNGDKVYYGRAYTLRLNKFFKSQY